MTISKAELLWGDDGLPRSCAFDDVYFSVHDPLAETEHVFLHGNHLPERFAQAAQDNTRFVVAETGFGTGLNFLSCWALWDSMMPRESSAKLHFISVEKFPLSRDDMMRIHVRWREQLGRYSEQLIASYPALTQGVHHLVFDGGRVRLTLFFGDAVEMFTKMQATMSGKVDAWFLDGFAPAKNQAMWGSTLYGLMRDASAEGATIASFTAAGDVRRGLQAVGFDVTKTRGFGHKRDMIVAQLANTVSHPVPSKTKHQKTAIVIGGGIAGASAAYALSRRGFQVTLLEKHSGVGMEASGNPAGILFPMMHKSWTPPMQFYAQGFSYTKHLIESLRALGADIAGDFCGMVQIPKLGDVRDVEQTRFAEVIGKLAADSSFVRYHTAEALSEIAGFTLDAAGYYFPHGGWVNVPALCAALVQHNTIHTVFSSWVNAVVRRNHHDWEIQVQDTQTQNQVIYHAQHVVIANALDAKRLLPDMHLPLRTIQGQVSFLPETEATSAIKTVVCYSGYMTPAYQGMHSIGATYAHHRTDCTVDVESHQQNLEDADTHLPALGLASSHNVHELDGRAALRVVSHDRLPLVGCVRGVEAYDGVMVSVAHASRGVLSAPLAGEVIAAMCDDDVYAMDESVAKMLNPSRFCIL